MLHVMQRGITASSASTAASLAQKAIGAFFIVGKGEAVHAQFTTAPRRQPIDVMHEPGACSPHAFTWEGPQRWQAKRSDPQCGSFVFELEVVQPPRVYVGGPPKGQRSDPR